MPIDRAKRREPEPIDPPVLHTGVWMLRPIVAADDCFILEAMSDPGMQHVRSTEPPGDVAAARDWVEQAIHNTRAGSSVTWIVTRREEGGTPLGLLVLQEIDHRQGVAEAGYYMSPAARRRGGASAALAAVARWALTDLGLWRVQLFHDVDNEASCRVAAAAGFAPEGVLRSSRRCVDGSRVDEEVHALVRDELAAEDRRWN